MRSPRHIWLVAVRGWGEWMAFDTRRDAVEWIYENFADGPAEHRLYRFDRRALDTRFFLDRTHGRRAIRAGWRAMARARDGR